MPYKGSGGGRHHSQGPVNEAALALCRSAPLQLRQGDALLYYHLHENGDVDVRALHRSCPMEEPDAPKLFVAKFVREASLLAAHGSRRTPDLFQDLRAWIDARRGWGLDASVVLEDGRLADDSLCPSAPGRPALFWAVRLLESGGHEVLCKLPDESAYQLRAPGEEVSARVVLANTGARPWPLGTRLALRDGEATGSGGGGGGFRVTRAMPPSELVGLKLHVQVPAEAGRRAHGLWTLQDGERQPFGPLLWLGVQAAASG